MKKRLLITTDCFLPRWDGVARFLKELIPHLTKEFEVTVAAPEFPGKKPEIPGVHIHRYPLLKIRFGDIYFSWVDKKDISRLVERADVVFNHTLGPIGMAAINAAHRKGVPIASYAHSTEWELAANAVRYGKFLIEMFVRNLAKRKYNKCDVVLTPSVEVGNILTANNVKSRKVVVPLGVDVKKFKPAPSKAHAKKAIGIDPKAVVIGFSGRIGREKDLPTLLNAFRRIQHKHNVKLLIVGSGIDVPEFKNPRIKHTGTVSNVVPYLQAMDIFVLPSLTETSSLATMEAMACGVCVVVTPVGSIKEYVEDGVNGFIFPRQDVAELAQKLHGLLKTPKAREVTGAAARETIKKRASWDKTARKILQTLNELAK